MNNARNGIAEKLFSEARRFFYNGKDTLTKAGINDGFYKDHKPVREACQTGWLAVIFAVQGLASQTTNYSNKIPKDVDDCRKFLAKSSARNGKVLDAFNTAYELLHKGGHYGGITKIEFIKMGFENARFVIEKLSASKV